VILLVSAEETAVDLFNFLLIRTLFLVNKSECPINFLKALKVMRAPHNGYQKQKVYEIPW